MRKCIYSLLVWAFVVPVGVTIEDFSNFGNFMEINIESQYFKVRSTKRKDVPPIKGFIEKCSFKEGLPEIPSRWINTLISRQEDGNPYSALVVETHGEDPVAVVGLGRMDIFNKELNSDIIDAYVTLGIIEFKDQEAKSKYSKDNIQRVGNWGLGTFCPIVPSGLTEEEIKDIFGAAISAFRYLKGAGIWLPVENTEPRCVMGLFHPNDSLIPHLKSAGFTILEKEGFSSFYAVPRVMAYVML